MTLCRRNRLISDLHLVFCCAVNRKFSSPFRRIWFLLLLLLFSSSHAYCVKRSWNYCGIALSVVSLSFIAWGEGVFDPNAQTRFAEKLAQAGPPIPLRRLSILHLTQVHWVEEAGSDPNLRAEILASQWAILQKLKDVGKDALVFNEGTTALLNEETRVELNKLIDTYKVWTRKGLSDCDKLFWIREAFPNRIFSDDLKEWNDDQKAALLHVGAPYLLWGLERLNCIRPACDGNTETYAAPYRSMAWLPHNRRQRRIRLYEDREIAALVRILTLTPNSDDDSTPEVYLVYGSSHGFENYSVGSFQIRSIP